jgi:hypothetical protein
VIDVKGIEGATRRDSVPIIAQIMSEIMALLFPLHKNNEGDTIITADERSQIIENIQKVVKIAVRKILSGELDIGEFIMTRVVKHCAHYNVRDSGWEQHLVTTRENRRTLRWWIKSASEIQGEYSRMANGTLQPRISTDSSVSYVLIQAPPNAKGFEKAEVIPSYTHLTAGP